ncbi:hypothetical protein E2320_014113 [Naja naja]|nr:hypothetical protein E2320_014113 [Naja naja]
MRVGQRSIRLSQVQPPLSGWPADPDPGVSTAHLSAFQLRLPLAKQQLGCMSRTRPMCQCRALGGKDLSAALHDPLLLNGKTGRSHMQEVEEYFTSFLLKNLLALKAIKLAFNVQPENSQGSPLLPQAAFPAPEGPGPSAEPRKEEWRQVKKRGGGNNHLWYLQNLNAHTYIFIPMRRWGGDFPRREEENKSAIIQNTLQLSCAGQGLNLKVGRRRDGGSLRFQPKSWKCFCSLTPIGEASGCFMQSRCLSFPTKLPPWFRHFSPWQLLVPSTASSHLQHRPGGVGERRRHHLEVRFPSLAEALPP